MAPNWKNKQYLRIYIATLILLILFSATVLLSRQAMPGNIPVSGGPDAGLIEPGPSGTGNVIYLPVVTMENGSRSGNTFMYGVLENAGFVGNPADFVNYINDWQSHGLTSALLINDVPDLTVSDRMGFQVVASPLNKLYRQWFFYEDYHSGAPLCGGKITIDCARTIIGPIVDPIKNHPSVRGYYIFDDATPEYKERIRLAAQVFQEHDAVNPASPGIVEAATGQYIYDYTHPKVFIHYDYPVRNSRPACDFNWVDRIRETMQAKPMSVPFWTILQAQGSPSYYLRTPTVEEVRLQNWLALGEDAKGIFWFNWSTVPGQYWIGIKDNPTLLAEITDLARRVNNLRPYLSVIRKISDKFQVTPSLSAYVSTLKDFSTGKLYVIAANHSCTAQNLTFSSWFYHAKLKDIENGSIVNLGTPITFRGGDGKLFEVINAAPLQLPAPQPNLAQNPSFEVDSDNNGVPDRWYPAASATRDTAVKHSGSASLKITGPSATGSTQSITLKPGTKYYMSWYMKGQNLVESHLGLVYSQDSPKQANLDSVFWNQNGSYDWVKRVGFFTTPKDYVTGKLIIGWDVKAGGTFWIDDLTLCEADQPCADAYLIERER